MKQIVFMKHLSSFETTSEEQDGQLDEARLNALYNDLAIVFEKRGIKLEAYEAAPFPIEKLSIRRCEDCRQLMVNRDMNPAKFDGCDHFGDLDMLCLDGGTYEGRELCEDCLPVTHRWGHFS